MSLLKNEHPDRASLFECAEQLEAGRIEFGSPIAAHVRQCKRCAAELHTMRRSITLTSFGAKTIEPTIALEASTILAMKSQRQVHRLQVRNSECKEACASYFGSSPRRTIQTPNCAGAASYGL